MAEQRGETAAWPTTVAVLGGGTMGRGLAWTFAAAGLEVRLADASAELARAARESLLGEAREHADAGLVPGSLLGRLESVAASKGVADAARGAELVVEAVPEQLDIKQPVLREASAAAGSGAVIATNTSSLPIDELARAVEAPERFLGTHWFNPPQLVPGVEIVAGERTAGAVVERTTGFLRRLGKRPVSVGGSAGFVANRIQAALLREALACVDDGVASPEAVDEVVRSTFGPRLPFFGPFQLADFAGLDVAAGVFLILQRAFGDRFAPPPSLLELARTGRLGIKSSAGFYQYDDEGRRQLVRERDRRLAAMNELLERLPPPPA